jgi:phage terminase large subunit-like protein
VSGYRVTPAVSVTSNKLHRAIAEPDQRLIITVPPRESKSTTVAVVGRSDSCGLIAASMTREGVVAVIADVSAPMTSDQWARAAVDLAVDVGASEIAVEGFAARETYQRVVKDALRRAKTPQPIRVTTWPPTSSGRGGGDAIARSAALLQGLETGTTRIAGHLPDLEQAAVTWQAGQHQPDALAALVVAHDVLVHSGAAPVRPAATVGRCTEPGCPAGPHGWAAPGSVDQRERTSTTPGTKGGTGR